MEDIPFFSVVMPAYNCENTVGKTIESVLNQTFTDLELIIVNDGSTDNTQQVIERYHSKDSRMRYKTIRNGGPGNARNKGIEITSGRYLLFVDSDDVMKDGTLEIYAEHVKNEKIDLVISSYNMNVLDGEELVDTRLVEAPNQLIATHEEFLDNVYPLMNKQLMYVAWNKIYKLDIIKKYEIKFPPYNSCEDRLFNIRYFKYVEACKVVNDVLYDYSFDGKNSLTNRYFDNKFDTFAEFYRELLTLTTKHEKGFSALFLKGVMSCIIPLHSESCPLNYGEKRGYIRTIMRHPDVIKASRDSLTDTKIRQVMKILFKTKSVSVNYTASKLMFSVGMTSPKTIEKFKRKF
mgnify:CR=1 FL=1